MSKPHQLTYAAIITIALPDMDRPATVSVTLTPQAMIETDSGEVKPLRDCSLAELQAFADALEVELWTSHQYEKLGDLEEEAGTQVKVTVLDDGGQPRRLEPEAWLDHAIILDKPAPMPAEEDRLLASDQEMPRQDGSEADGAPSPAPSRTTPEETTPVEDDLATAAGEDAPSTTEDSGHAEVGTPEEADREEPSDGAATGIAGTEAAQQAPADAAGTTLAPAEEERERDAEPAPADGEAPVELPDHGEVSIAVPPEETPVIPGPEPSPAPPEMEPAVAAPELRIAGLRRPVGHPTQAAVDILINEPAFRDTQAHALSTPNREVAGMLIGPQPEKQPDGRYVVHVTDAIIARHTRMHGASVTYTPESWRHVTDILHERYPNEEAVIVGWYHTHPGFGIFLSGMDLFIHQNFFTQKWHIAFVLDPLARTSGFFCWNREQRVVQAYDFPWPPWALNAW
jgi:proteasome lid subunit RPN8/RPN11